MVKKILVLDLDNTLIYSYLGKTRNTENIRNVVYRPFLIYFLKKMEKYFTLVLFSAASKAHTENICKFIEEDGIHFKRIYDKSFLRKVKKVKKKDLRIIVKDLSKILMIDDKKKFFLKNQNLNVIIIKEFRGNLKDRVFIDIIKIMKNIAKYKDVREGIKKNRRVLNKIMSKY